MCILCVIQKWSRSIATMLPWLVIPLIGLWALSQLLPPAFRFEITSSRLACLLVLLVTLFWYEVLMPQLSVWRVRRNAKARERERSEAIEMQKLRKTATRRCRNCSTAYRDQNPGGGKFMCSYCGHSSKRPVLDLPVPPGICNSGILNDLVGRVGNIWGKACSENWWVCGQDWPENRNWAGGSFSGKSNWKRDGGGLFGGDDSHCLAEKSYSRVGIFACNALKEFLLSMMWLWRKIFRIGSSRDDALSDSEHRGMLDNRSENGGNGQESRGEKARRKAEEKRQARLEKELLEEEERKQREEVARLVEERRRLRDEKVEAEKERGKGSPCAKERDSRKGSERKCQERKKGKDRGSSKSNSDAEELEKGVGKESEQNKRSDFDRREQQRNTPESMKTHDTELGYGFKGASGNHNRGNDGTRYLDRMRGTFLSSSRAFSGGGFFGKNSNTSTVSREQKSSTLIDNAQTFISRKEIVQPDHASRRPILNGDDESLNYPVLIEPQPSTAPKKSWQQLFTRTLTAVPPSNSNVISRPTGKHEAETQCTPFSGHPPSTQSSDKPNDFGLQSPFSLPSFSFGLSSSSTVFPLSSEVMLPKTGDSPHQFLPEESEIFEDPCYVPDPVSLLGPVSESLDSFQLDLGFVTDTGMEKPCAVKTKAAASEVTKPSPIESPLSRSRVSEDSSNSLNDNGTWQMWNSYSLVQDGLGLVGGPVNWILHPEMNLSNKEDNIRQLPHKTVDSLFKKDEKTASCAHPPQHILFGNSQNGGTVNTTGPAITDGSWVPRTLFGNPDYQAILKPKGETAENSLIYGSTNGPAANHQFDATNSWTRKEWMSGESVGSSPMSRSPPPPPPPPRIGGLYSRPDVQSLWSYE